MIRFEVLTEPQAQPRHRHRLAGRRVITYDPAKRDKAIFLKLARQYKPDTPLKRAIRLRVDAVFSRPMSHYGTGRNANKLKPRAPFWHTSKPDFDNVSKFCTDAMNGVFYQDDKQICSYQFTKRYGREGRVFVELSSLGGEL